MRKFIEAVKSILLIFLAFAMLALWTGYVYIQFDKNDNVEASLDKDFWVFSQTEHAHFETAPDSSFFTPRSISLILSGNGYTSAYSTQLTSILYNDCTTLLKEIFSSPYVCERATLSEWEKALDKKDAILIEFSAQLPYTVVANFLEQNGNFCEGELCYIEKILLYSDSADTPCAISIDSTQNVHTFTWHGVDSPSFVYDFNSNNLAAYTVNEGFIPFEFNKKSDGSKTVENLPSEYKLLSSPPSLPAISVTSPIYDTLATVFEGGNITYLELVNETALASIFEIFEINPHIVGYYSDPDSGLTFVGEDMRLEIEKSGTVQYTVIDKSSVPITAESLLNTARKSFDTYELLAAATSFISRIPDSISGGEASLNLYNIGYSSESDEMSFSFVYQYRTSDVVYAQKKQSVVLVFNSKGLVRAQLTPMNVSLFEGNAQISDELIATDIVPALAARMSDGSSPVLEPVYSFEKYGETVVPFWATGGQK